MLYHGQKTMEWKSKTGVYFTITGTKLYVPVVTLFTRNNIKFLENIKQEFKISVLWNKYRSEITEQLENNNLDYLIHPVFMNIGIMVIMILREILVKSITCHSKILMYSLTINHFLIIQWKINSGNKICWTIKKSKWCNCCK